MCYYIILLHVIIVTMNPSLHLITAITNLGMLANDTSPCASTSTAVPCKGGLMLCAHTAAS